MLKFDKFSGINNVLPPERLVKDAAMRTPLAVASNVDIGLSGELLRRGGFAQASSVCHKNVWEANGFVLATRDGGDLVNVTTNTVLYPSLGVARVWYVNLPDGRTAFSNGAISGVTDGATLTPWGVPVPLTLGAFSDVAGALFPGQYQWQLTYRRTADGLEGGPLYANDPVTIAAGGFQLTGLPVMDGYSINVYLTSNGGEDAFLAGNTATDTFSYTGANDQLVQRCLTEFCFPPPAGTLCTMFGARAVVALGNVLYASLPARYELFDMEKDFIQFSSPVTLIEQVDDGLYVGTQDELAFLEGRALDKLVYHKVANGGTVLGSGVQVRGELVLHGDDFGKGRAMMCIADKVVVAGFSGGDVVRMTEGRYTTNVTEVAATFRVVRDIPQYIAIPQ